MSQEKSQFNLKVKLQLGWKAGDDYTATVTVTTTDSCYHAVKLRHGLPKSVVGIPEITYITYEFKRDEGKACGEIVRDVTDSIVVKKTDASREVTAYCEVNGSESGHASQGFPR
jgi:ketopantoate hydroxymethyltransferase